MIPVDSAEDVAIGPVDQVYPVARAARDPGGSGGRRNAPCARVWAMKVVNASDRRSDNGDNERPSELVSERAGEHASHATSAPARACSVALADTRRIRPSAFFESTPATECSETNFVTAYRAPRLSPTTCGRAQTRHGLGGSFREHSHRDRGRLA